MYSEHLFDIALFYLIICYITLLFKENKSCWKNSSKYILYAATVVTFIFLGLFIGFRIIIAYIIVSVIILVVCLPVLRIFLEKRRKRNR